jgi:glycerol-3-phosphate responsive antiterminator
MFESGSNTIFKDETDVIDWIPGFVPKPLCRLYIDPLYGQP